MKKHPIQLILASALFALVIFTACNKTTEPPVASSDIHNTDTVTHHNLPTTHHQDSVALVNMKNALHHMKQYHDSLAKTHNDPHKTKYYDSLFHKSEAVYWHEHKNYTHTGTETIHDSVGHHTDYADHRINHHPVNHPDTNKPHDRHHVMDSLVAAHHKFH